MEIKNENENNTKIVIIVRNGFAHLHVDCGWWWCFDGEDDKCSVVDAR